MSYQYKRLKPEDIRMLNSKKEIVIFNGGHMVINKNRWFEEFEGEGALSSNSVSWDEWLSKTSAADNRTEDDFLAPE